MTSLCMLMMVCRMGGVPNEPPRLQEDPARKMVEQMDRAPKERQPPDWEETKALMTRKAPAVGEAAPDFVLKTPDGKSEIKRSTFQEGRPLVLLFGSYT